MTSTVPTLLGLRTSRLMNFLPWIKLRISMLTEESSLENPNDKNSWFVLGGSVPASDSIRIASMKGDDASVDPEDVDARFPGVEAGGGVTSGTG